MDKVSKSEYEDRIAHVFSCAASVASAKDGEVSAELRRLMKAVDRLIGCDPVRMTDSLSTRRLAAVMTGYGAISAGTVRVGPPQARHVHGTPDRFTFSA